MRNKLWIGLALLLITAMMLVGCNAEPIIDEPIVDDPEIEEPEVEEPEVIEPFRIGFLYIGVPGDLGWTFEHERGRLMLVEEYGDLIETTTVEGVAEGPDAERVMRDFAQQGYDMIFATSFGYMDAMYEVSQEFPDVIFEHASGYTTSENMATYFGRIYQPRYLSGIVAGMMTETNSLGYVAAFPIPEVIRGINAFTLGVRSVNPDATVSVVWTNTWFDPPTEREAAISLLDEGVDVIAQHQDTTEPQKAAQEYGVMSIGYNSDMREFVGESVLTGPVWNWGVYYIDTVGDAMAGTWQTSEYWGGMDDNLVQLADFSDLVTQEVQDEVEAAKNTIIADDAVFCGPINGQDGETMIAEGECMSDGEMLGMSWFVEGVIGTID
jgi:basic membrane protein A and related proteins